MTRPSLSLSLRDYKSIFVYLVDSLHLARRVDTPPVEVYGKEDEGPIGTSGSTKDLLGLSSDVPPMIA